MLKLTLVLPPMLSFTLKPKAVSAPVPPTKLLIVALDRILPSFKVRALVDSVEILPVVSII
jgi:hypothetical protein